LYDPPIDEFSVIKIALQKDEKTKHRGIEGPSICIVTKGDGRVTWGDVSKGEERVKKGDVVFVGAGEGVEWGAEGELEVFRAFVEVQ
jgi:mannose-6-phosphate isomerase